MSLEAPFHSGQQVQLELYHFVNDGILLAKSPDLPRYLPGDGTVSVQDG